MNYKIITPVLTEPVTLAEAKQHIRVTTGGTFNDDVTTAQSIIPGSYPVSTVTGTAVDVLGYTAMANLSAGVCGSGGSVSAKIQESDDSTTWNDWTGGTFTIVTEANDNAIQEIAYTGVKQYIRVIAAVSGTDCSFSADVLTKSGDTDEDTAIEFLITTAREYCENYTRRALATQTIEAYLPTFPHCDRFELPHPPLQSVTSVKYKDSTGTETTMVVGTNYLVDDENTVAQIVLPYGLTWPLFTEYPVNAVKVRYVAGYASENPIPRSIKQAMLLLIGHWYNNREAVGNVGGEIAFAVKALLSMYKVGWF